MHGFSRRKVVSAGSAGSTRAGLRSGSPPGMLVVGVLLTTLCAVLAVLEPLPLEGGAPIAARTAGGGHAIH